MSEHAGWTSAWDELEAPFRRCLELAWTSCASGSFACGAVITGPDGAVVAEGRNRLFDVSGGDDVLRGTPLAHAEMNALAKVRAGIGLDDHTLWTSLEPCLMCLSSALLAQVGTIRSLAPDPLWDGVEQLPTLNAFVERRWPALHEAHDGPWALLGMALGLHLFAFWQPDGPAVDAHDAAEPEAAVLARRWAADRTLVDLAAHEADLGGVLDAVWDELDAAATVRDARRREHDVLGGG
jgi:tRNA(Arg) A34 adenosine deaminase TadA